MPQLRGAIIQILMEPYVLSAISAGGLKIKRRVKAMNREKLLKNAKPILFNTEMVQAILEGRKTVTRRLINPRYREDEYGFFVVTCEATGKRWVEKYNEDESDFEQTRYVNPPYKVGDILYVRETWGFISCDKCIDSVVHQDFSPGCGIPDKRKDYYKGEYGCFMHRTNYDTTEEMHKWKPSIHMPKEAARIFLKVKDVRVERVQDMCVADCVNEGVTWDKYPVAWTVNAKPAFIKLWDKLNAKRGYGWEANPWVWVIEFERR